MRSLVILNPYSGRWQARRRWPEASEALRAAGVEFELWETSGAGDATELARRAVRERRSPILLAGGDGLIGEAINGLYRESPDGPLGPVGLIPLGTANDLAHNLGLPLDFPQAAGAIAEGKTRRIDLGLANEWVFANNSAVGLEPVVSQYNARMVRWRGLLRYLVAALRAINDKPAWHMRLIWDGGEFDGPISLVSVGNGAVTGGIFRMAPEALPDDGRLTFVFGFAPTRRKMLSLLPRTISGEFVRDPAIQQHHTRRLTIEAEPPTPIQADGEIRGEALSSITYQVLPARLDVISP